MGKRGPGKTAEAAICVDVTPQVKELAEACAERRGLTLDEFIRYYLHRTIQLDARRMETLVDDRGDSIAM